MVVGTLLFCRRRKKKEETQFQIKSKPLDSPTYFEKSESNDGGCSTLAAPHYDRCQKPYNHVTKESDYATVENDYST